VLPVFPAPSPATPSISPWFGSDELEPRPPAPPPDPPLLLEEIRETLRTTYYRLVPESVLEQPSIELMLEELGDPYTEYLDRRELASFRERLSQSYYGVGLTVGPGEGGLIVTSSWDGPARRAGIRPGDIIVAIDGLPAATLPFDRSAALIKGEAGTVVRLTVQRPGKRRPLEFSVVRHETAEPAVRSRLIRTGEHRVGYVRIVSFREDAADDLELTVRRLLTRGAEGFILDLRGDPGGLLSQAVEITSVFLEDGMVCSTSGLHRTESFTVSGEVVEATRPLAVLVDGATASAAEIVAAALADNGRAALVGQRTYGKAAVQTVVPLENGGALKLTTATYRTPSGANISETGIRPEIKATDLPLTKRDEAIHVARDLVLEHL
jgi:carboxyl-terminal processing protease